MPGPVLGPGVQPWAGRAPTREGRGLSAERGRQSSVEQSGFPEEAAFQRRQEGEWAAGHGRGRGSWGSHQPRKGCEVRGEGSGGVGVNENSRQGAASELGTPELLYPEGSRGSKRLMGHRVHRAPGLGGWAGSPLPGLAGLLASGPALPLARPSRRPADRLPSSPAIPLSPPTLVAETISPCPAKGLILTGCDLSNKTLGGRARRSGELGAAGPGGRHVRQSRCFPT